MHAPSFVSDLAVVLVVASVTALLFRRLGQPAVLAYLVAGLIVGPYIPIPVFADAERTHALSELGVVLVMFVVGLELRLRRLVAVLPTAGATALIEVGVLMGSGYAVGRALGWGVQGAIFLGAAIAISSTMVVSKVFEERAVATELREHVMSVLVLQDVLAIVMAAVLTAVAAGRGLSAGEVAVVVGQLAAVLVGMVLVGLAIVPRLVRAVIATESKELLVVVCVGLCFGLALLADALGYSVALGAFIAGVLVAESGRGREVEHLVQPVRDIFAAIFFVAIGMGVDPRLAIEHAGTSLLVFAVVVIAQLGSVALSGVLSGNGLGRSVRAGLALGQVGEFGFILAAIGIDAGVAPPALAPIVVTVAVLTAFTTPIAIGRADAVVRAIDHALPRRLQDVLSLYEAWFEKVRASRDAPGSPLRRTLLVLAFDGVAVVAVVVATSVLHPTARAFLLARASWLREPFDAVIIGAVAVAVAAFPAVSFVRATRALGAHIARIVFGVTTAATYGRPRRLLEVSVQLLVLLAVGIPAAVLATPFAGPWFPVGLAVLVVAAATVLWRTAGGLAPQVQTSAGLLVDLLARESIVDGDAAIERPDRVLGLESALGVTLGPGSPAVGKTLAELDLRAVTGATVVAIRSADAEHRVPTGREVLREGDVLAIAGSSAAIDDAQRVLLGE